MALILDSAYRALPSPQEALEFSKSLLGGAVMAGGIGYLARRYVPYLAKESPEQYALYYMAFSIISTIQTAVENKLFEGSYVTIISTGPKISAEQINKAEPLAFQQIIVEVEAARTSFEDEAAERAFVSKLTVFDAACIRSLTDCQIQVLRGRVDTGEAENKVTLGQEAHEVFRQRVKERRIKEFLKVTFYAAAYIPATYWIYKLATALGCRKWSWETSPDLTTGMIFPVGIKVQQLITSY